jgi:hypothetical protein
MKIEIEITEQEIKDLKLIRKYFGEHDKTQLEHLAYSELDKLVKKLQQADVIKSVCTCIAFHKSDECYKLGCKAHRSDGVQTVL